MVKNLKHNNKTIAEILIADTFTKRFLGYMFRKKPHCHGILFSPCNSIHSFFMNFNIDVLFVSEDMTVIKKVEGLKPGKIVAPVSNAKMAIEGIGDSFKDIKKGDRIVIE